MEPVNLIRSEKPVYLLMAPPRRDPTVAVVYADHLGRLHHIRPGQPVGRWDQCRAKYKTRYEVEMCDFNRKAELRTCPPLAADGTNHFETCLLVSFRVRDPVRIVRRAIHDPLIPVYAKVVPICRQIASRHGIEHAREAEKEIDAHFAKTVNLPDGIDIFRVKASLTLDESTRAHLETKEGVVRQDEIAKMRQKATIERWAKEASALGDRPTDMVDFVRLMLERDPDNLEAPKELLLEIAKSARERQNQRDGRVQHLFDTLADKPLLRADVDRFRDYFSGADRPPGVNPPPSKGD
jgi:hypothetical protein